MCWLYCFLASNSLQDHRGQNNYAHVTLQRLIKINFLWDVWFGHDAVYSHLYNNRGGWNKRVGVQKLQNQLDFFQGFSINFYAL